MRSFNSSRPVRSTVGARLARNQDELAALRSRRGAGRRADIISPLRHQRRRCGGRPDSSSARPAIASLNLPRRAAAIGALLVGGEGEPCRVKRDHRLRPQIENIFHFFEGYRAASALAGAVDDEDVAVAVAGAQRIAQPRRIARRSQCLVGDDDRENWPCRGPAYKALRHCAARRGRRNGIARAAPRPACRRRRR